MNCKPSTAFRTANRGPSRIAFRRLAIAATICSILVVSLLLDGCASGPKAAIQKPTKEPSLEQKRLQGVEEAQALLAKGEAGAAADKLGLLAAAFPSDTGLKLAQASALVSARKLAEAKAVVDSVLAAEPANIRALVMGAQLARFGDDDKARQGYLNRALAIAPADVTVLEAWGDYYLDAKSWPQADDFYRRALTADPKSAEASLGLGRALYREAKYPESEAMLSAAIALDPASSPAYSDRSRARYQQGKYKEAEEDLDSAIAKAPDDSWLYLDRGRFLLDENKKDSAKADFDKAIALDPSYFLAYVYRGGILEEAGDDSAALADYRKSIELYPDYWYSFESAGAAAFRLGLWAESAADFKRAFSSSPGRYEYAIASALAMWRAGRPKDASAFAGSLAPTIDRQTNGIYWAMLRLLQDQNDATAELEVDIQGEKKLDLRSTMLFYLSEYWICKGKTELASKYLSLVENMKRQGTLEYRLLRAEQKRLASSQNG